MCLTLQPSFPTFSNHSPLANTTTYVAWRLQLRLSHCVSSFPLLTLSHFPYPQYDISQNGKQVHFGDDYATGMSPLTAFHPIPPLCTGV